MESLLERLIEVDKELLEMPPKPELLWGKELTTALLIFHTIREGDFNEEGSVRLTWFELGRRYERKWPQPLMTPEEVETLTLKTRQLGNVPTPEQVCAILQAREEFAIEYGRGKGWPADMGKWDIKQILEVREQPGWKEPEL